GPAGPRPGAQPRRSSARARGVARMMLAGFDLTFGRLLTGVFTGLTYGLLAVGLVLVFRASRFINFASAAVGVAGASVLGLLVSKVGLPYWVAFPLAVIAGGLIS